MKLLPLILVLLPQAPGAAETADCIPTPPLPLNVRIGADPAPRQVLLFGGSAPALHIVDPRSGATLWSAGATAPAAQRYTSMTAAFAGSLTALDTDHDGLHDRLYAGDLDARLWRFDLHNGSDAHHWSSGGVFADFSNAAGRGFRASPDVSLHTSPGTAPWLHIAIGTAAPGHVDADNRFYVLRDHAPFEAWTGEQYEAWRPLREVDLSLVATTAPSPATTNPAGYFIELGRGEITTPSLTVAGRIVLAIAQTSATPTMGCRSAFSVAALDLVHGQPLLDAEGTWRRLLHEALPASATLTLTVIAAGPTTTMLCSLGDARVAECDVDLRPRRSWWRRGDAE
jgi:hypothetical protein